MVKHQELEYTGKTQPEPGLWYEPIRRKIYPYYPSEALKEAVNLAISLKMPLLLEGEPGCGKSRLAHALIYEFSQRYGKGEWGYEFWNIQSTTKAQDGFYTYDYIGRLQAAQLQKEDIIDPERNPANPENFVIEGVLQRAFEEKQYRTVVLIDEIDKADRDFPNDLLLAIEERRFYIKETQNWIEADEETLPIILITSNQEQSLPSAFLRRCLYHYIEFPTSEQLIDIVRGHFPKSPSEVVNRAIERFLELRDEMEADKSENEKKISTSELLVWFQALNRYPAEKILAKLKQNQLPHPEALLKTRSDLIAYTDGA